jgi:hypothetical protein
MELGQSESKAKYYYDLTAGIFPKPDVFGVIKMWIRVVEPKMILSIKGKRTTYTNGVKMLLYEIKCKDREMRLSQYVYYTSNGKLIDSGEDYESYSTPVPGSIGSMIFSKYCID